MSRFTAEASRPQRPTRGAQWTWQADSRVPIDLVPDDRINVSQLGMQEPVNSALMIE